MPPVSDSEYWRALFRPGARWQHLKTKRVVTVSSVDGKLVKMAGGEEAQRLLSRYRPMPEESKPGPTLRQVLRRAAYRAAREQLPQRSGQ
jgi:hypothetical protein